MNPNNPPIVVGVGYLDRLSPAVLRYAADEAQTRGTGIHVLHGCAKDLDLTSVDGVIVASNRDAGADQPAEVAAEELRRMTSGHIPITVDVPMMTGEQALVRASESACLIVVQRQSGGALGRLVAGSTASTVAAQASCPVVVIHAQDRDYEIKSVVAGIDDRGLGQQALTAAADEAAWRHLPLTAAQAWLAAVDRPPYVGYAPTDEDPVLRVVRDNATRSLAEAVAGLQESYPGVEIRRVLLHGDPVESLMDAAGHTALLVVARHSSRHLASIGLGHVARTLISKAQCPVMVTPPGERVERGHLSHRGHEGASR